MNAILKIILIITIPCLLASCSEDFLNENIKVNSSPVGLSNIYISPDWQRSFYLFKLPSVKEVDYKIISRPSWLNVKALSGHLTDSIAIIECSATENSAFHAVGIYMDFMTVAAEGKNYKVPVGYINEGDPSVYVPDILALSYTDYENPELLIRNNGSGILIWEISSMPDWLAIDAAQMDLNGIFIPPFTTYMIPLQFKYSMVSAGNLSGTIVLSTNDKNQPQIIIKATADIGTPQLNINTNTVYFSYAETSQEIGINNSGNGILFWEFKDIPEWLTITPSNGIFKPYSYISTVKFSCDRTKLSPGQNSAIINLKTNDSSQVSCSIGVSAYAPDGIPQFAMFYY